MGAQEDLRRAREELEGLLSYHFPARTMSVSACPAPQTCSRRVRLRVDAEYGAGIDMTPGDDGYHVDHVEDYPGQDFVAGEVIVEINGQSLSGLSKEALEETFGSYFGDGASVLLMAGDL